MLTAGESRKTWRKTCPSDSLSATNNTWTEVVWNPGLRGERPAAIRHGG